MGNSNLKKIFVCRSDSRWFRTVNIEVSSYKYKFIGNYIFAIDLLAVYDFHFRKKKL